MIRTQIYLTQEEKNALTELSAASGKKQSVLIREAIDVMIEKNSVATRRANLARAAGMWKDRDDLPDYEGLHKSWDRDLDFQ